jgi:hypothetical protein
LATITTKNGIVANMPGLCSPCLCPWSHTPYWPFGLEATSPSVRHTGGNSGCMPKT